MLSWRLTTSIVAQAGAVAGIVAMSSTYPLDMVRGRLTVQSDNGRRVFFAHFHILRPRASSRLLLEPPDRPPRILFHSRLHAPHLPHTTSSIPRPRRYRGIVHAATTIIKEEGPRALYKGWLPSVIGVVPYVGLNFAVYETLKARLSGSMPCAFAKRRFVAAPASA